MTKVSPVCLVGRGCLDCLGLRNRAKVSPESLVSLGSPGLQDSPDPRESPASTDSQEWPDPGATMAFPVYLVILESPAVLEEKVSPESLTDIQEVQDPKASPETQASQEAGVWTVLVETTGSQEVQGTVQSRVSPENRDVLE